MKHDLSDAMISRDAVNQFRDKKKKAQGQYERPSIDEKAKSSLLE